MAELIRGGASSHRNYLLNLLLVILAFNLLDRIALGIVLQDIKVDLSLSDTELGLLTGIAFALFYSVMGIPIGRWADRGDRVTIITITTALWSVAVALCGAAGSFVQLMLIRIVVGVGEAGCIPPAHSLIADYFARSERPRAVARYMLGFPLSAVMGYFLAGWLNQFYGWRITFALLGLPGLVLAALAWFTLREPRRGKPSSPAADSSTSNSVSAQPDRESVPPSLKEACIALWANTTFRHLLMCWSVMSFFGYGITQWKPTFFIRSFGLQTGEVGTWFAVIYGVTGLLGTYIGGALASRLAVHNEPLQLKAMALAVASFGIISACIYFSPNAYLAFGLLALSLVGIYTIYGPLFATIQTLVPPRMRALSISIIYLIANLIGLGLGPLLAGVLSDGLRPVLGEESLRYALLMLSPGYLWSAWHLSRASKTVASDLEAAQ